jgi:hypothetical protein
VAVKLYAHWLSFFHPVSFCIYLWQSNYILTDFRFPSMFYLRPFLVSSTFVLLAVKLNAHCIFFFHHHGNLVLVKNKVEIMFIWRLLITTNKWFLGQISVHFHFMSRWLTFVNF